MADVAQAQIISLANGIQASLAALQTRIEEQILSEAMPLVGTGLAAAAQGGQAALNATETLGQELANALDALAGAASQTKAAVHSALESALDAAGFLGTTVSVTVAGGVARITVATEKFGEYVQDLAGDLGLAGLDAAGSGTGSVGATFDYNLEFAANATGFFVGTTATDEVSQLLNPFEIVSIAGQEKFSVLPAIDTTTGNLTFTTAENANGFWLAAGNVVDLTVD
ncbi:MAG: hypothetical protein ABI832_14860, partial [bacterium]